MEPIETQTQEVENRETEEVKSPSEQIHGIAADLRGLAGSMRDNVVGIRRLALSAIETLLAAQELLSHDLIAYLETERENLKNELPKPQLEVAESLEDIGGDGQGKVESEPTLSDDFKDDIELVENYLDRWQPKYQKRLLEAILWGMTDGEKREGDAAPPDDEMYKVVYGRIAEYLEGYHPRLQRRVLESLLEWMPLKEAGYTEEVAADKARNELIEWIAENQPSCNQKNVYKCLLKLCKEFDKKGHFEGIVSVV